MVGVMSQTQKGGGIMDRRDIGDLIKTIMVGIVICAAAVLLLIVLSIVLY